MTMPKSSTDIRINLGSGDTLPAGWINIDNSWHARISKVPGLKPLLLSLRLLPKHYGDIHWRGAVVCRDITKPLPFASSSVECIYASHIIEHLFIDQTRLVLREALRILRPGKSIRIIVPDLDSLVNDYADKRRDGADMAAANALFVRSLFMVPERESQPPIWVRWFRGRHDKNMHRWLYNAEALQKLLTDAGFVDIQRKNCFDSNIVGIKEVENPQRFPGAFCLEAKKP